MNLVQLLLDQENSPSDTEVIQALLPKQAGSSREYKIWTRKDFVDDCQKIASYLQQIIQTRQENIAILSNTRPEWMIADFAIMMNAGVVVSLYQTLTPSEIAYLLYDSGAEIIFAENQEQVDKILSLIGQAIEIPAVEDREATRVQLKLRQIIAFDHTRPHSLVCNFSEILAEAKSTCFIPRYAEVTETDLASIVYTSGTTGLPKGVIQSHGNHLANIQQVLNSGILRGAPSLFVFLPLAHSFAKLMAYLGLLTHCSLKFPSLPENASKFDPESLMQDIREANAHIFPIVPRILEKIEEKIRYRSKGQTFAAKLLALAIKSAQQRKKCFFCQILFLLLAPIRQKIRTGIFGNNFSFAVSGGAKLNAETNQFFDDLGILILQGYGLTETCVATNINRLDSNQIGTVGPVLDSSIELRIEADQEISFRGPNVALGYWRRPKATAESWTSDGWFLTGDLGALTADSCLKITGRKKEIIVTSYGKKIAPLPIEYKIKQSRLIDNAVLFGNDRPFCVALIVVNQKNIQLELQKLGVAQGDDYLQQRETIKLINDEIELVNAELASYEEIKKFTLIDEDFTIENGLLTPTMKTKVGKIYERYSQEIDRLYLVP